MQKIISDSSLSKWGQVIHYCVVTAHAQNLDTSSLFFHAAHAPELTVVEKRSPEVLYIYSGHDLPSDRCSRVSGRGSRPAVPSRV